MSIRVIQLGAGIRGRHWAGFIRDYSDAKCVAFVDPDLTALEAVRSITEDNGCKFEQDLELALKNVEADAALVVTPSILHADQVIRCLDAGLTVMVEKPLAVNVDEAQRMIERSNQTGKQIIVAENYRFFRAERTVKQILKDGRIGEIDNAVMVDRRHMPSYTEGPWLANTDYAQLQEIAIHHFDSLRAFFGSAPKSVTVKVWNPGWTDYKHGTNTEAFVDFDKVRVQYFGTLLSHRFSCSIWVEGSEGSLWTDRKRVFWRPKKSRWFRPVRHSQVPPGDEATYPRAGTTALLNALRDAVKSETVAETEARDNIWTVAMVEAGKISDRERRTVALAEVYEAHGA
ncbi:MAG: Gfo/Idh/MocA family oxidoreductase [Pseudomonadota bacterium]